jgi:hypothetical protein
MECGESSPLFFLEMESGEDSPHSTRFAISVTVNNPAHPIWKFTCLTGRVAGTPEAGRRAT